MAPSVTSHSFYFISYMLNGEALYLFHLVVLTCHVDGDGESSVKMAARTDARTALFLTLSAGLFALQMKIKTHTIMCSLFMRSIRLLPLLLFLMTGLLITAHTY